MLGRSCPQIALCAQPTRIAVSSPDQDLGQLVVSGAISTAMTKIEPTEYLEQQQQQQPKQRHHQLGPNTNANTDTDTDTDTACKRRLATDRGGMPTMTRLTKRVLLLSCIASASAVSSEDVSGKISPPPYLSLRLVETTLRTTAKLDFGGHEQPFQEATRWSRERLRASRGDYEPRAPHLACAEYGHGREAASRLKAFLSREAVRPVYHASEHGACFLATASDAQAAAMSADPARFELTSIGAFPSALKIAPDLLDHDSSASFRETSSAAKEGNNESGRLTTRHGYLTRIDGIEGLSVELSPGTLPARSLEADAFIRNLLEGLMSESVDLHACNFWSDPSMSGGEHLARPEGALRGREWSRAATVVHELSEAAGTTPGDVCSWGGLSAHHAANDVLLVSGAFAWRVLAHVSVPIGVPHSVATAVGAECTAESPKPKSKSNFSHVPGICCCFLFLDSSLNLKIKEAHTKVMYQVLNITVNYYRPCCTTINSTTSIFAVYYLKLLVYTDATSRVDRSTQSHACSLCE